MALDRNSNQKGLSVSFMASWSSSRLLTPEVGWVFLLYSGCWEMLMTSSVFTSYVVVDPLAGSINFCLFFSSVDYTMLSSSSLELGLGPPSMLYYCKRMPCAGPPFKVIVVMTLVLEVGLVLEPCKGLLSRWFDKLFTNSMKLYDWGCWICWVLAIMQVESRKK